MVSALLLSWFGHWYTFFHLDSQWNTYIYNRQAWMAYRCQQYNLFTRLLSVLQRHSPQTRSFSSPVIACHLSIWQPGMEHVPAVRFLHHFLGGTLGGRSGRNSRSYIVQTQRPSTTGTFHWRGRGRQQQSSGKRRSHYESGPRKKEWLNQSFRHHEIQRAGRAERSNNPLTELNECSYPPYCISLFYLQIKPFYTDIFYLHSLWSYLPRLWS